MKQIKYIDDKTKLVIRTSAIKTYLRCPAQCFFRYFKGLVIMPSSSMMMGSCFHKSAEHHYKYKKEKGKNSKLSTLQDVFHDEFKLRKKSTQWNKDEKPDVFEKEGVNSMLPVYYKERAIILEPKEVEIPVKITLEDANAEITGTLDLILQDETIRDHKTKKRLPNWLDPIKSTQGYSYSLGYLEKFGKLPKGFNLDYIIRSRNAIGDAKIETSKTIKHKKDELENFKALLERVISSMRQGNFYPCSENNFLCSPTMCGFWDICHKGQWKNTGVFTKTFCRNSEEVEED